MILSMILTAVLLAEDNKPEPLQFQTFTIKLTPEQIKKWNDGASVLVRLQGARAFDVHTAGYRLLVNLPEDTPVFSAADLDTEKVESHTALIKESKHALSDQGFFGNKVGVEAPGMINYISFKKVKEAGLKIDPAEPLRLSILALSERELTRHVPKVIINAVDLEFYPTKGVLPLPERKPQQ